MSTVQERETVRDEEQPRDKLRRSLVETVAGWLRAEAHRRQQSDDGRRS